jgi:hypothetical protein
MVGLQKKRKSGDDLIKSFIRERFYFLPDDDDKKAENEETTLKDWQENIPLFCQQQINKQQ